MKDGLVIQTNPRDARIDLVRGACLMMIFIDHIDGNRLARMTIANFGFITAAEIFIVLAGYSSAKAYGSVIARSGVALATRRISRRCVRMYAFYLMLLVAVPAVTFGWTSIFAPEGLGVVLPDYTSRADWTEALTLALHRIILVSDPQNHADVIRLYILMSVLFIPIYFATRVSLAAALVLSAALWLLSSHFRINFYDLDEARSQAGWMFNPLTWQLYFIIGAAFASDSWNRVGTAHRPLLLSASLLFMVFSLAMSLAWRQWGPEWLRIVSFHHFGEETKTYVTVFRALNVLAFMYVIMNIAWLSRLSEAKWLSPLVRCGRHSLEVFVAGVLLSLLADLVLKTFGYEWYLQAAVNASGVLASVLIATTLDRSRNRQLAPSRKATAHEDAAKEFAGNALRRVPT
jgi:hypothetical protein